MKKVLLYSGGMDSWLMSKLWKPDIKLYVDMKTRYSENELKRVRQEPDVQVVEFPLGQWEREDVIIPLRNLYLAMVACNVTGSEDVEILIGATAGDRVLDKSYEYVEKASDILSYLYQPQHWIPAGKKVKVCIDYKKYTKTELLEMYKQQGGDLHEAFCASFSCYDPVDGHECWQCKPCFRKFVAFAKLGYQFKQATIVKVMDYMDKEIVPQIKAGTYGRGEDEESDIMNVYNDYFDLWRSYKNSNNN